MRMYSLTAAVLLIGGVMGLEVGYADNGEGQEGVAAVEWTQAERERGYVVFSHSTLALLPDSHVPTREAIVEKVSCELARGEYESLQIGVHAVAGELKEIRVEVESDLEVRVYHRVSPAVKQQLAGTLGQCMGWLSPEGILERGNIVKQVAEGKSAGLWLTFHAQPNTPAGMHRGKLRIQPVGKPAAELDLQVHVRRFELQPPRIAFGMYFPEDYLVQDGVHPQDSRTDTWLSAIYRDMAAHGQNSVTFYSHGDWSTLPPKDSRMLQYLPLAKQAGLARADIACMFSPEPFEGYVAFEHSTTGLKPGEQRRAAVSWLQAECQKQGWPELMLYGWDEPGYPIPGFRERYLPWRDISMRLETAMDVRAAYGYGDLHDVWVVYGGQITPEMRAEAQRLGAEVWTYSCNTFPWQPLRERYYAGLYTWAHQLGGNWIWAYYDHQFSHVWWAGSGEEPLPMLGWEARREGIDDYRYLQMLQDCVAAKSGDPLAAEAGGWLEALRTRITTDPHQVEPGQPLELEEYDRIRAKAADYIQQLGPVPPEQIQRRPVTHLKDEAKPFRDRSVGACLAGLRSENVWRRRAAAWALFERGPEAAAATEALAEVLGDADVRMPALRALEAIGPEAYIAVPKIAALLRHPDGFVRLGAGYALGASGASSIHALTKAVQDEYAPAAQAAGRGLAGLGHAALPALPVLIKLLDGPTWESQEPALKAIAGIGPEAAAAVPHIVRNWQGQFPCYSYWIEPLAAIGPGAAQAVPMLEKFRKEHGSHAVHSVDAEVLYALYRIRRSPEDLRALVNLIGTGQEPNAPAALGMLEKLGSEARDAAPWVQELIARGGLSDDVKKRLEAFLVSLGRGPASERVSA